MPIFTAIAAAVTAVTGSAIFGAVASFAARTLLTIGITKLVANRANTTAAGTQDAGARVQLPPATNNKIPVVYGKAYIAPVITDAKISTDQKYMWYVCSLAEVTDTGSYTFGDIYYNGKKVIFGDPFNTGKVTSMETNSNPIQIDDKVNGKIYIWRFPNGSSSGIDTGASNAINVMSDSTTGGGIPSGERWNGPIYTSGGQSADMTNMAFMIVRVEYNQDAGTTGLGSMNVELTNSIDKPGDVLYDYMTNTVYGCAIPSDLVDTASLTTLNTYSDQLITYTPVGGGSATQPRYRVNGPINTGVNCLDNLQTIVDTCDSWLQYSELTGKWKVVINQSYTQAGQTLSQLYQVTDSNLIGGININPIDLNNVYNVMEVQYPNQNIKDQTDFRTIQLIDYVPEVISKNEPVNTLTIQFPIVNNYIQALYLGIRRLLQNREDLTIDFTLDYSGIQIEAGDLITVPFTPYGWESFNSGYGKIFRVSQVQEAKLDDGSLGARITAFEYNSLIYTDNALQDFVPEANTGLTDPNIISQPGTPIAANNPSNTGLITSFSLTSYVPDVGVVTYMDFNYGNTNNVSQHVRYTSIAPAVGQQFVNSDTANSVYSNVTISINDLPAGNYYFSTTARNDFAGRTSNASALFNWAGANITPYDPNTGNGGVSGNIIRPNTLSGNTVIANTLSGNTIIANTVNGNTVVANTLFGNTIIANTVNGNVVINNTLNGNAVANGTIQIDKLANGLSVAKFFGGFNFNVAQGSPAGNSAYPIPLPPADATLTVVRNIPLYIQNQGWTANGYYPYLYGTSSTAPGNNGYNYYIANSTGPYNPVNAAFLAVADGEDSWYVIVYDLFPSGTIPAGYGYNMAGGLNYWTDTPGAQMQVIYAYEVSSAGYLINQTDSAQGLKTIEIPTDFTPYSTEGSLIVYGAGVSNITAGAILARCITPGASIFITGGTISSSYRLPPV